MYPIYATLSICYLLFSFIVSHLCWKMPASEFLLGFMIFILMIITCFMAMFICVGVKILTTVL